MEPKAPVAGDTVQNVNGAPLPDANPNNNENGNANQPAQGNGDGSNSFLSEAEELLKEANQKVQEERLAREKAEKKIVELKREAGTDGGLAKVVAELQTQLEETVKKSDAERSEDRESMKVVIASLLKKNQEAGELRAAVAAGKANLPNISSQNQPAPGPQKQHSAADVAIARHFKIKLD